MVEGAVPGERWEIEVFEDREPEIEGAGMTSARLLEDIHGRKRQRGKYKD